MSIAQERLEAERVRFTHPFAFLSADSRGRRHPEVPDTIRTPFERDGHRILHAKPFRRLRNKTQVFFSPENDHITTRMDHSLYVATISRTICRALRLNDDLAYAIALGHDLGHAPFGHSGEKVLEELLNRRRAAEAQLEYTHEAQSLRVVDQLSAVSGRDFPGLNLCYEIRDGIRCHCGESTEQHISPRPASDERDPADLSGRGTLPITVEGCVVRMADRIAYLGRDYEDAQTALGDHLPTLPRDVMEVLGQDNREIINTLVQDVIACNQQRPGEVGFSERVHEAALLLRDFNYQHIYYDQRLEEYREKADSILECIFEVMHRHLLEEPPERWGETAPSSPLHMAKLARFVSGAGYAQMPEAPRVVVDFISMMTDGYAFKVFESIVLPQPLV